MRLDRNSEINEVDVSIAASSGGLPGTVLESFHLSNALPLAEEAGAFVPLTAITSSTRPLLRAGTPYWVVASITGSLEAIWLDNDTKCERLHGVPKMRARTGSARLHGGHRRPADLRPACARTLNDSAVVDWLCRSGRRSRAACGFWKFWPVDVGHSGGGAEALFRAASDDARERRAGVGRTGSATP